MCALFASLALCFVAYLPPLCTVNKIRLKLHWETTQNTVNNTNADRQTGRQAIDRSMKLENQCCGDFVCIDK